MCTVKLTSTISDPDEMGGGIIICMRDVVFYFDCIFASRVLDGVAN